MSKAYARPSRETILEVIAAISDENLRRRARETYNDRKGWSRTSACKNGSEKRMLSPADRVFAHLLYSKGKVPDRIGECILHCKWRNGMNFWNARNDGKRLLAAKRRAACKAAKADQKNEPKVEPKVEPVAVTPTVEVVQNAEPVEV